MIDDFQYLTVENAFQGETLREKGSKFNGFIYPIKNEEEVKLIIEKLKLLYPKANHFCYAYRLGKSGEKHRIQDDGEPSGSAGLPILNQLIAKNITYVLLVVVRFFGGTKLGVSGLIKAYKEAAILALNDSEIIQKELETILVFTFPFSVQQSVFAIAHKYHAKIVDFSSTSSGKIEILVPIAKKKGILDAFAKIPLIINLSKD